MACNHVEDEEFHIPPTSVAPGSVYPPPMRNHSTCAVGDNKLILFGGFDGSYEFSDLSLLTFSEGGSKLVQSETHVFTIVSSEFICAGKICV